MSTLRSPLDAALAWAVRGLPVLPVRSLAKAPRTKHGLHDATTNPSTLRGLVGPLA